MLTHSFFGCIAGALLPAVVASIGFSTNVVCMHPSKQNIIVRQSLLLSLFKFLFEVLIQNLGQRWRQIGGAVVQNAFGLFQCHFEVVLCKFSQRVFHEGNVAGHFPMVSVLFVPTHILLTQVVLLFHFF